jgi:hypothetical protein
MRIDRAGNIDCVLKILFMSYGSKFFGGGVEGLLGDSSGRVLEPPLPLDPPLLEGGCNVPNRGQ